MPRQDFPIFILSFNRPHYLEPVLASLQAQKGIEINPQRVFLMQDGAVESWTGERRCAAEIVARNIALFRRHFPDGQVIAADGNLGIALNFDRTERLAFETLNAEAAVFLEDDLVLGPFYLKTLNRLIGFALDDERIGYVAAYGYHRARKAGLPALVPMAANWGFGLTRRQWLRQQPFVDEYLRIVGGAPYRLRDQRRIAELFHGWGFTAPGPSQDYAKWLACILTGAARLTTIACHGKYIGAEGEHFSGEVYEREGYGATKVVQEDGLDAVPDEADVPRIFRENAGVGEIVHLYPEYRESDRAAAARRAAVLWQHAALLKAGGDMAAYEGAIARGAARFPRFADDEGAPVFASEMVRLALARGDAERAAQWESVVRAALANDRGAV